VGEKKNKKKNEKEKSKEERRKKFFFKKNKIKITCGATCPPHSNKMATWPFKA
jgi:hypothetical protein